MDNRNHIIDIVSALFVIEIVIAHLLQKTGYFENSFFKEYVIRFLGAFLPWFYFKAGLMFNYKYGTDMIWKRCKKLLWPYMTWSILSSLLALPLNGGWGGWIKSCLDGLFYGQGAHCGALWFLFSLFLVYVLIYSKLFRLSWEWFFCLGVLSFYFNLLDIKLPLGVNNLPLCVFFFLYGIKIKKMIKPQFNLLLTSKLIIAYMIMVVIINNPIMDFRINKMSNEEAWSGGGYILYLLVTSLFLFIIYQLLYKETSGIKFLEYVGRKSMILYVCHIPIINLILRFNNHFFHWSNDVILIISSISVVIVFFILAISENKMKWMYDASFLFDKSINKEA